MKKTTLVIVLLVLLFSFDSSQAQSWTQIQNAMLKKGTPKEQNKSSEDTDQNAQVEAAMMSYGKNKVDASAVPNSYTFSWKYIMEIKNDDGKAMNANYILEPEVSYFGFNMAQGDGQNMLMIMDTKNKLTVTCFGNGKDKMASASKMADYSEMGKKESEESKFVFKMLPNKIFLGYNCKGMQATNNEYEIVFYYTNEAKVSFGDWFRGQKNQKIPQAIANYFKPGEKILMMDMTMKDLKKKEKLTTMKCISLEKSPYVFKKADYKFM